VFKDEEVKHIFFDTYIAGVLYVATSRHVYEMKEALKQLFASSDDEMVLTAAKYKGTFYIGTSQGLYKAGEDLLRWEKSKKIIGREIYDIETGSDKLYLASSDGAYSLDSEGRFKRLFIMRSKEDTEEPEEGLTARSIRQDLFNKDRLWLGTNQGLFMSSDSGRSWKKVFIEGIDTIFVNAFIQIDRHRFYVAAREGFFLVDTKEETSRQIVTGLYSPEILWVEPSSNRELYLATARGLFRGSNSSASASYNYFDSGLEREPDIREIQERALWYNDVQPEKIRAWRRAIYLRALMPSVSLDYDKTITYDSGVDRYYQGPKDWGISLSWDVGDLIWNSYHDDVDTRSRLNTQLRLDILDEINRVYFERLRLKKEIVAAELSREELSRKKLRLYELTAVLDGYTGGFFSRKTKELNSSD
jgi:hypothetical protein